MKPIVYYPDIYIDFQEVFIDILRLSFGEISTPIPYHSHGTNCFEFHFIASGRGILLLENQTFKLTQNCFFITGPGVKHAQLTDPQLPLKEYCINFSINFKPSTQRLPPLFHELFSMTNFFTEEQSPILARLQKIFEEFQIPQIGSNYYKKVLIEELLIYCIRLDSKNTTIKSLQKIERIKGISSDTKRSLQIDQYFLGNYQNLSLNDLAQNLSISPRQTQRLLKKLYQQTFLEKLLEARMNTAVLLLKETEQSISLISENVGYSSVEHFTYAFKKHYGQTATSYRKKYNTYFFRTTKTQQ